MTCSRATGLAELMSEWGTAHPYSTLDIFLARPLPQDWQGPRPGVCFTLNTAFAAHLDSLGMQSAVHLAGVQDHDSPDAVDVGSHLTVVTELDGRPHLTDVGLGCGPLRPVPLQEGAHDFQGFTFSLAQVERDGRPWWRMDIPPELSRAFTAMEFSAEADPVRARARADHFLSTATSPLRDVLLIQGWVGDRLVTAYGTTVSVRSAGGIRTRDVHHERESWCAAIHAWFPDTFDDQDLRDAWDRLEVLS